MSKELMKKYNEQKENLKKHFENQRIGDQNLYTDQAKLFKPIIESQKEYSKEIQNKLVSNQENLSNALVPFNNAIIPFTNELKRKNDQVEGLQNLQNLPYYNIPQEIEDIPQSTPKKERKEYPIIDIDGELRDQTHFENLEDMSLPLPSIVQESGNFEQTLKAIVSKKRSLSQLTKDSNTKRNEAEKVTFKSQQDTLTIYERKIKKLHGVEEFIEKSGNGLKKRDRKLCKQKRGRGRPRKYPDIILYNDTTDLCEKLNELVASKRAGNSGVDNNINIILDELLNTGKIDKNYYNNLFKNIFPNYK